MDSVLSVQSFRKQEEKKEDITDRNWDPGKQRIDIWARQVNLSVISIEVVLETMRFYELSQAKSID